MSAKRTNTEQGQINEGFYCVLDPRSNGRYEVWIKEKPYRGVETDHALAKWERVRVGESWTDGHLVGSFRTRWGSLFAAVRTLRKARRRRQQYEVRSKRARANLDRERIYVR